MLKPHERLMLIRQALRRLAGRQDPLARKARARLLGELLGVHKRDIARAESRNP